MDRPAAPGGGPPPKRAWCLLQPRDPASPPAALSREKRRIRRDVISARDAIPPLQRARLSAAVCRRFERLAAARRSRNLMVFMSFGSEVDTRGLIEWAWRRGKRVVAPLCRPERRGLDLYAINGFDDLRPGHFCIPEPKEEALTRVAPAEIDLVVVPAVAFDRRGYRVGYGGGYYDRFLAGLEVAAIGLAFSSQLIAEVPVGPHDRKVSGIVTEREFIAA